MSDKLDFYARHEIHAYRNSVLDSGATASESKVLTADFVALEGETLSEVRHNAAAKWNHRV